MADDLQRDLKTLTVFIELYCRCQHTSADKQVASLRTHDVATLAGKSVELCPDCLKLLTHALVKRTHCPMDPKPMCKHCPDHCYAPAYREKIQEVMRFSGRRMVMGGRVDYLLHLLF